MSLISLLIFGVVFFFTGEGIHCFNCNSNDESDCINGGSEKSKVDCDKIGVKEVSDLLNGAVQGFANFANKLGGNVSAPAPVELKITSCLKANIKSKSLYFNGFLT